MHYQPSFQEPAEVTVRLHRNTWLCAGILWFACHEKKEVPGERWLHVEATANLFDGARTLVEVADFRGDRAPLKRSAAEAYLWRSLGWRGRENVYSDRLTTWMVWPGSTSGGEPGEDAAGWDRFWTTAESGSSRGRVRYSGGNVWSKAATAPESVSPGWFRLHADSAGYRAGKDGKDLGADVDLIGPGPAYERWKKTPAYQQWLRDTKQFGAEAPKPEPKAFALLGAKGVEVGKYDILAEAVRALQDGDTIEVRGNGPFVSEPIQIKRPLTIRAGEGFRPVIKLSPEAVQREVPLLDTNAALVLEGLELHRAPPDVQRSGHKAVVKTYQAPLRAANCRFRAPIWANQSPVCVFRNCEFVAANGHVSGS